MMSPRRENRSSSRSNNRLSGLLGGLFGSKSSKKRKNLQHRTSKFESLEVRKLLSVTVNPSSDPGDSIANAYSLTMAADTQYDINATIGDGTYTSKDVDMYEVSLTSGDQLTADIDAEVNGSPLDSYLRIFDSNGTEVAYNDDFNGVDSKITYTASSTDTYYVGVSPYENQSYDPDIEGSGDDGYGGAYTLSLTKTVPTFNDPTVTMSLYNDTDTPDDLVTTDPAVTGTVTFEDDDAYGTDSGYAKIEFDNNDDGNAESFRTLYSSGDTFNYDPSSYTPALPFGAPTTLKYRVKLYDAMDTELSSTSWDSFQFTYNDSATNTAPVLTLDATATGEQNASITINGSFTDPNNDTWSATVDYGDGSATEAVTLNADKTFTISHTYANQGNYTATVSIDDGQGGTDSATSSVTVTASSALVVTSLLDTVDANDGAYTLREAIADANATAGANTIVFDPALDLSGATDITLTGGQLTITDDLTIAGPERDDLTISAGDASRIFYASTYGIDLTFSEMTLTEGYALDNDADLNGTGGAICVRSANSLTITEVAIMDSAADGHGGGLYMTNINDTVIRDTTFTNNTAPYGGGLLAWVGGTVGIADSTFLNNDATVHGGGAYLGEITQADITNSTLSGNAAALYGGGVYAPSNTNLAVNTSTFSSNSAQYGGGMFFSGALMKLENSLLSENTATVGGSGGGIFVSSSTSLEVNNTTIVGNTSTDGTAGGVYMSSSTNDAVIRHSTIAGNSAVYGGGFFHANTPTLHATLIAQNTTTSGYPDIYSSSASLNTVSTYNLIGDGTGMSGIVHDADGTGNHNQVGTSVAPIDPMLAEDENGKPLLADNGGPVWTVALLANSPARDAAGTSYFNDSDGNPITTDARGSTRMLEAAIDIGAVEMNATPILTLDSTASGDEGTSITLNGSFVDPDTNAWTATVDYGDGSALDTVTLNPDKTFTIAHTYADDGVYTVLVSLDDNAGGTDSATATVTTSNVAPTLAVSGASTVEQNAVYSLALSVTDPGDDTLQWTVDWGDGTSDIYSESVTTAAHVFNQGNITRTITVTATDEDGSYSAGTVAVNVTPSTTMIVDSLLDTVDANDGAYTLREAIADANAMTGANTIVFDPALDLSGATDITLTGGQLVITDDLTITGPGADQLTISGNNASRLFVMQTAGVDVQMSGMTLTGGNVPTSPGGAIYVNGCTLILDNMTLDSNTAKWSGAISVSGANGVLTITNTQVTNNSSEDDAGAIGASGGATLTVGHSVFHNNETYGDVSIAPVGGAMFIAGATATIEDSVFTANRAVSYGGAIAVYSDSTVTISRTTFGDTDPNDGLDLGNKSLTSYGGAITQVWANTDLRINDSVIAGNSAAGNAGGIYSNSTDSVLEMNNTSIVGNFAMNGVGGGVCIASTVDDAVIRHSTIAGNASEYSGGGLWHGNTVTLHAMLIAENTSTSGSPDVYSSSAALSSASSYNLIGDGSNMSGITHNDVNGNQVGTSASPIDPLLAEDDNDVPLLADNGGSVYTVALLTGSPALDAAGTSYLNDSDSEPITTDARGYARMVGPAIDVGAFELISDQPYIAMSYDIMGPVEQGVTGPGPVLAGDTIDFGTVDFDTLHTLPFTISNVGTQTLILDLDNMTLPEGVRMTDRPYEYIDSGASVTLILEWDGQSSLSGAVTIPTNDPGHTDYTFTLSGTVLPQADPVSISSYGLLLDSGTDATDGVTYNPLVEVSAGGDFVRGTVLVEFDHGYAGHAADQAKDGQVVLYNSGDSIVYDPRTTDASWPTVTSGTEQVSLNYRVKHLNEHGRVLSTSSWTSFTFQLEPTPTSSTLTVSGLATAQGLIGDWTTSGAVAVTGTVSSSANTRYVQVAVDGETLSDAIGTVDAYDNFSVNLPFGLSYLSSKTVTVRAYEESADDQMNLYGAWTSMVVQPATPTAVDSLYYNTSRTDDEGNPLPPAIEGYLTSGVDSRYATVELYYNDGQQDIFVGETQADEYSAFTCVPRNLPQNQQVTVYARMVVTEAGTTLHGASLGTSVTYSPTVVSVGAVALADPEVEGGLTTDNPELKITSNVDIGTAVSYEIKWSTDGGTTWSTPVQRGASAVYDPDAAEDATTENVECYYRIPNLYSASAPASQTVDVSVRAATWDFQSGGYVYGSASAFQFTYDKPTNAIPSIVTLVHDGTEPTVTGTVSNDGDLAGLLVELYDGTTLLARSMTDAEGAFTLYPKNVAPNTVLTAKVREWNALIGDYQESTTGNVTYTYAPPPITAPQVASFGLADDTLTPADNITTHALLTGSLTDDGGELGRVLVQIDYDATNGVETIDAVTFTDADGVFYHLPTVAVGTHTMAVRAVRSNISGQDATGNWLTGTQFTLQTPTTGWTPEIASVKAYNGQPDGQGNDVSNDTLITGVVSSEGGFADLVVAIDLDADGTVDQEVPVDAAGRFAWAPTITSDPSGDTTVTINVQAGRTDQSPTSWGAWTGYSFIYHDEAVATPESSFASWTVAENPDYSPELSVEDGWIWQNNATHTISGTVTLSEAVLGGYVEIDYRGGSGMDGQAELNADGEFQYFGLPDKHTIRVRIRELLPDGTYRYPNGGAWETFTLTEDYYGTIDVVSDGLKLVPPVEGVSEGGVQVNGSMTDRWVTIAFQGGAVTCDLQADVNGFISETAIETALITTYFDPGDGTPVLVMSLLAPGMNLGEVTLNDATGVLDTVMYPVCNPTGLSGEELGIVDNGIEVFFDDYENLEDAIDELEDSMGDPDVPTLQGPPETEETTSDDDTSSSGATVTQSDIDRITNEAVPTVNIPDFGGSVPVLNDDQEYQDAIDGIIATYHGNVNTAKSDLNSGFKTAADNYNSRVEAAWQEYNTTYEQLAEKLAKLENTSFENTGQYERALAGHQSTIDTINATYETAKTAANDACDAAITALEAAMNAAIADIPNSPGYAVGTPAYYDEVLRLQLSYGQDYINEYTTRDGSLIDAAAVHQNSLATEYKAFAVMMATYEASYERNELRMPNGVNDLLRQMAQAGKAYETELAAAARDLVKGDGSTIGSAQLVETYRNAVAKAYEDAVTGVYAKTVLALGTWASSPDTDPEWATYITALVTHAQLEVVGKAGVGDATVDGVVVANTAAVGKEALAEKTAAEAVADADYAWATSVLGLQYTTELALAKRDVDYRIAAIDADYFYAIDVATETETATLSTTNEWDNRQTAALTNYWNTRTSDANLWYTYDHDSSENYRNYYHYGSITLEEYTANCTSLNDAYYSSYSNLWGSYEESWTEAEAGHRLVLGGYYKGLGLAISAAQADKETRLIAAAETYWDRSIAIGVGVETDLLARDVAFIKAYNGAADTFTKGIVSAAERFEGDVVDAAETRATADEDSETALVSGYITGFFDAVDNAYSSVTGAWGTYLQADAADLRSYYSGDESSIHTLVTGLITKTAGAITDSIGAFYGMVSDEVTAMGDFASKLLTDADTNETKAIDDAKLLAEQEVDARVAYLEAIRDAEKAARDREVARQKAHLEQRTKTGAEATVARIGNDLDLVDVDPPSNAYVPADMMHLGDQNENFFCDGWYYYSTGSTDIPVPYEGHGGLYFDAIADGTSGSYENFAHHLDPIDLEAYDNYHADDENHYEFGGVLLFETSEISVDIITGFADNSGLQSNKSTDRLNSDEEAAATGYAKAYHGIYGSAAGQSEGLFGAYLGSEIGGVTAFSTDLWNGADTANGLIEASIRKNDPTSVILTYMRGATTAGLDLSSDLSGNFGAWQTGWRTEENDPDGDLAYITGVVGARDAFYSKVVTEATTYTGALFGSLQTYSDNMLDADLTLGNEMFAADRGFSTAMLGHETDWTQEQFDASSKQRLAYLDAAIVEADGQADKRAEEADTLANASGAIADQAQAEVDGQMQILEFVGDPEIEAGAGGTFTGINGNTYTVLPFDSVTDTYDAIYEDVDGTPTYRGSGVENLEGLTWMTFEDWQTDAQTAMEGISTTLANETTARTARQNASITRIDQRNAELAADRKTAEDKADDDYRKEAAAADNKYVKNATQAANDYVTGYNNAISGWETAAQTAEATYSTTVTAAATAFDDEACRLAGLYLDAIGTISDGGAIDTATYYDTGTSLSHVDVCFVAGTPVVMADGTSKPIERIEPGDQVLAAPHGSPETPPTACTVTRTYHNAPSPAVRLVFLSETGDTLALEATPSHPFYVVESPSCRSMGGAAGLPSSVLQRVPLAARQPVLAHQSTFVEAHNLQPGDTCLTADGRAITLLSIETIDDARPVFNLEVEDAHTYYVGDSLDTSVLVHNTCSDPSPLAGDLYNFEGATPFTFTLGSVFTPPGGWTSFVEETAPEQAEQDLTVTYTDENGGETVCVYDADNNLLSLTDPVGNETTWTYDADGLMTSETNALGLTSYYEYSDSGLLTRYTDRRGVVIEYDHNIYGEVSEERWFNPDETDAERVITYTHDRYGRLTHVDDADTDYAYEYDEFGRLRVETVTTDDSVTSFVYRYDGRSRVESVTAFVDGQEDFTNAYKYNASGMVRELTQTGPDVISKRVTFDYDVLNHQVTQSRYEGENLVVTSTSSYSRRSGESPDANGQYALTGINHVDAYGNVLASHGYTYNDQGLIDTYANDTDSVQYDYDPTGQLIDADYGTQTDESFEYDANGNRLEFTIGANNQILCDGLYWYSYDEEGSRTAKYQWTDANADGVVDDDERFDVTTYSWDARGRLIKIVTLPDGSEATKTVKYSYDYLNRRTDKQIKSTDESGKKLKTKEHYTYLGHDIVLQQNDGQQSHRYLHHPDIIDQCLADEDVLEDNTLYPLFDNLNSVRDIVDYGEILDETLGVNHIDYSASGKVVAETDPTIKHIYGHAGRERDDESHLLGNGERYFDPYLNVFISQDRLGYFAHDTNVYRYVGNSPTNVTDPTGLETYEQRLERLLAYAEKYPERMPENSMYPVKLCIYGRSPELLDQIMEAVGIADPPPTSKIVINGASGNVMPKKSAPRRAIVINQTIEAEEVETSEPTEETEAPDDGAYEEPQMFGDWLLSFLTGGQSDSSISSGVSGERAILEELGYGSLRGQYTATDEEFLKNLEGTPGEAIISLYRARTQEEITSGGIKVGLSAGPIAGAWFLRKLRIFATADDIGSAGAAGAKGLWREQRVASITGGRVTSGTKVVVEGLGSTDIDVIGELGEYIAVGGPAKARNLAHHGRQMQRHKAAADAAGVRALAFFEEGTPQSVIDIAKKWLGDGNVFTFPVE